MKTTITARANTAAQTVTIKKTNRDEVTISAADFFEIFGTVAPKAKLAKIRKHLSGALAYVYTYGFRFDFLKACELADAAIFAATRATAEKTEDEIAEDEAADALTLALDAAETVAQAAGDYETAGDLRGARFTIYAAQQTRFAGEMQEAIEIAGATLATLAAKRFSAAPIDECPAAEGWASGTVNFEAPAAPLRSSALLAANRAFLADIDSAVSSLETRLLAASAEAEREGRLEDAGKLAGHSRWITRPDDADRRSLAARLHFAMEDLAAHDHRRRLETAAEIGPSIDATPEELDALASVRAELTAAESRLRHAGDEENADRLFLAAEELDGIGSAPSSGTLSRYVLRASAVLAGIAAADRIAREAAAGYGIAPSELTAEVGGPFPIAGDDDDTVELTPAGWEAAERIALQGVSREIDGAGHVAPVAPIETPAGIPEADAGSSGASARLSRPAPISGVTLRGVNLAIFDALKAIEDAATETARSHRDTMSIETRGDPAAAMLDASAELIEGYAAELKRRAAELRGIAGARRERAAILSEIMFGARSA